MTKHPETSRRSRDFYRALIARKWIVFFGVVTIYQTWCAVMSYSQSSNIIGKWNTEVTFANGTHYSLRFDAQENGKGTFQLVDARSKVWGAAKPSEGKWTQAEGNSVVFSGPIEFLLGNVGRDAGTLVLKGKFESASLITGEVEFSPLVGEGPSKHGTFKAVRPANGE